MATEGAASSEASSPESSIVVPLISAVKPLFPLGPPPMFKNLSPPIPFTDLLYISRKGPLIVYGTEGAKLVKAFRNIPGVEVANVERLNLLKLAPGGHLGRFIIWTKSAFEKLDSIYGSFEKTSEKKKAYVLPRAMSFKQKLYEQDSAGFTKRTI